MKKRHEKKYLTYISIILSMVLLLSGCTKGENQKSSQGDATTTPSSAMAQADEPATADPSQGATDEPTDEPTDNPDVASSEEGNSDSSSDNTSGTTPNKVQTNDSSGSSEVSDEGTSAVVNNSAPAVSTEVAPEATGSSVYSKGNAEVDYSNMSSGYVMIRYLESTSSRIKVRITVPDGTVYTYNLNSNGSYETFPLSGGSGSYKINVYKQVSGSDYAKQMSTNLDVSLNNPDAPFLHSNQYVNYSSSSYAVSVARQLTSSCSGTLDKVNAVYQYVISHISYDYNKASNVKSGYLPDIDSVLSCGKGICFDYAAVMTAMLRSQGIPTKLVVGYANSGYHAWISVYVAGQGWIDGVIYFDGNSWQIMDPTFASTQGSEAITKTSYSAKYLY